MYAIRSYYGSEGCTLYCRISERSEGILDNLLGPYYHGRGRDRITSYNVCYTKLLLVGPVLQVIPQAHFADEVVDPVAVFLGNPRLASQKEGKLDIFPHREHRYEVEALKDKADEIVPEVRESPVLTFGGA